ncbi:MAG: hypothetical protein ACE5I2_14840 [Anaerolineae bacterium]
MPRWWLAVGPPNNWETAFELGNIWGLKASGRPAFYWEHLSEEDNLLFYVTLPISGVIGYGTVRTKLKQDKPLWPEELREHQVLWPLRIEFDVDYCLPRELWKTDRVASEDVRVLSRAGFQPIDDDFAETVVNTFPSVGEKEEKERGRRLSLHDQLIEQIVEAGHLQKFVAEREYNMEGTRLDAVWRRVANSVPTYVFEVQIGGDLYHALGKLKHAFDLWNSHIFLVAQEQDREKVSKLLSGTFHEIGARLQFIDVERFQTLLEHKREVRNLESQLGLL